MNFSYQIDSARHLIFLRLAGRFTLQALIKGVHQLWADPAYHRSYGGLVDISDGAVWVNIADLHQFIAFIRDQPSTSEGRWAAVTSSPLATACGLLYQKAIWNRHPFEVFTSFEAACDYLHIGVEHVPTTLVDRPLE